MRPLTDNIPKPMVRIQNKPLIGHVMDMVQAAGCTNIVTNVHYKPEPLLDYLNHSYGGLVSISDETDMLLDSGGGVVKALEYIENDIFYIINADCIWHGENALLQMSRQFNADDMDILKLLSPSQDALGFDEDNIYAIDKNSRIVRNKDNAQYSFTGIQIVKKSLFEGLKPIKFSIRTIWDKVYQAQKFYGCPYQGQWLHIGTPQAVKNVNVYFDRLKMPEQ